MVSLHRPARRLMPSLKTCACTLALSLVVATLGLSMLLALIGGDLSILMENDPDDDDMRELAGLVDMAKQHQLKPQARRAHPASMVEKFAESKLALRAKDVPPCGALLKTNPDNIEWVAKRHTSLRKQWKSFVSTYDHVQSRLRYCVAYCDLGRCCDADVPGEYDGWRGVEQEDWYRVLKDDLKPMAADDGFSDVTMVTQGTVDRLEVFDLMAEAWPGPKVAVFSVYSYDPASKQTAQQQLDRLSEASKRWHNSKVVAYIIFRDDDYFTHMFRERERDPVMKPPLPLNVMRNLAVDMANTNFVFTVDMDFVPSHTLYPKLITTYLPVLAAIDRVAIVIPHWEALACGNAVRVPSDFARLKAGVGQGIIRPFHASSSRLLPRIKGIPTPPKECDAPDVAWNWGVESSSYEKWYKESEIGMEGFFPLHLKGPHLDRYYEPFTIIKRVEGSGALLPRYEEKYVGRFKNKVSFVSTLRSFHYPFFTMRQEFLVHVPHPYSNVTSMALRQHLLEMRELHAADRNFLRMNVFLAPADPPLQTSPYDHGIHCTGDLPEFAAAPSQ